MQKSHHINNLFLILRRNFRFLLTHASKTEGEGIQTDVIGGLLMASQYDPRMRLTRNCRPEILELLLQALWGNQFAVKKLLKHMIEGSLKKDEFNFVIHKIVSCSNSGHAIAKRFLATLSIQAPQSVLQVVYQAAQQICQRTGKSQALDALQLKQEEADQMAKSPTPFKMIATPLA